MGENGVSVVICCFNSEARLPDTLKHLADQVVPPALDWEIIVVDNASTDNTTIKAKEIWHALGKATPLRVVAEHSPGLTKARIKGINAAQFDLIIFCDDDNWLQSDFLANAKQIQQNYPDLALFGIGESTAVYESEPARWFRKNKFEGLLACFKRNADEIGFRSEDIQICGAGMCLTKSFGLQYQAFLESNPIHAVLDRTGNHLLSGGDSDINFLCAKLNLESGNFLSLRLRHFIPSGRLKKSYVYKLIRGNSFSSSLLRLLNQHHAGDLTLWAKIKYLARELTKSPLHFYLGLANLQGRNDFKQFAVKHQLNGRPGEYRN